MGFLAAREFFADHYFTVAFVASLGVIQLAAARGSLRGLWLARQQSTVRALGLTLLVLGAGLYYLTPLWTVGPWADADTGTVQAWDDAELADISAAHNVGDTNGGLSGNTQAILMLAGCAASFTLSALVGLVLRRGDIPFSSTPQSGLDALRRGTIVEAAATTMTAIRTLADRIGADATEGRPRMEAAD